MKEFFMREIHATDNDVTVSRSRTSEGFSSITIKVGEQSITLNNTDNGQQGKSKNYERIAQSIASLIEEVVANPCTVPNSNSTK